MRSPRLTERVSRISSEPRAIVSTTAAVVSVIPARLIGGSRSRSHPEATRATTTGAAAPMIPALAGLVWRRPAYQRVEVTHEPGEREHHRGGPVPPGERGKRAVERTRGEGEQGRRDESTCGRERERPQLHEAELGEGEVAGPDQGHDEQQGVGVSLAHDARQEMERPCRDGADRAERHEWRATSSFSSSPPSFSPSCHPPPDPRASRGRSCSDSRGGPKTCQGENTG
jgi:hypothetical protein